MNEIIKADLAKISVQESRLVFIEFNESIAWRVGSLLRDAADNLGHPVVIDIRRGDDCLFFSAMPGTTPANADWARRKRNLVNLLQESSYALGLRREMGQDIVSIMSLDYRDFASHGGCFPVRVAGAGMVGTITISGLPQREDHKLVIDVLSEFLRVPLEDSSF